jgi:hypothetical protein
VAVGEMPSLTAKGETCQSQMLYDLLSDYSIILIQLMRFIDYIFCGFLSNRIAKKSLQPISILEYNQNDDWQKKAWKYAQRNFFDEKIQDDIIQKNTSDGTKDEK